MADFYTDEQRELQDEFESRTLADALEAAIVTDTVPDDHRDFIESRDFFFLSTVNAAGEPTVSHKGGAPGFVRVIDESTLAFPHYDGNGMFLSMGNVAASTKIGMLFIDFETPHRVRVQATATIETEGELFDSFPGANVVVKATTDAVFVNCGRYIHKHTRTSASPHVPDAQGDQPLAAWKRIDAMQDVLPPKDQGRAESEGGVITMEDYAEQRSRGEA